MIDKEEILLNTYKENCSERIYKFQKVVNHDLIYKAMDEYGEEILNEYLNKLLCTKEIKIESPICSNTIAKSINEFLDNIKRPK